MNFLLIFILSLSSMLFCNQPIDQELVLVCALSFKAKKKITQNNIIPKPIEEGLCAGTLIKTPHGYAAIEDLQERDYIASYDQYDNYYEQPVLAISKRQISSHIKITIDNQIIYAALDQKFYVPEKEQWVKAHDLVINDTILQANNTRALVEQIEKIDRNTIIYSLKLENPQFYITEHDIYVHNTDALSIGAQIISIGALVLNNPILATIGSAIELAELGMQIYEMINDRINTHIQQQTTIPHNALQERIYYENRKNDLIKLKQEFLEIKHGLQRIVSAQQNPLMQCTAAFLEYKADSFCNICIGVTALQESQLDIDQRQELTKLRQQELDQLEREIKDLQVTLAVHFNELIIRRNQACEEVTNALAKTTSLVSSWNQHLGNINSQEAQDHYKQECINEYLLQDLDLRNKELKFAIGYYKNSNNAAIFKNTTNILEVIAQEEEYSRTIDDYIQESKSTNNAWRKITEDYFVKHRINASNIQTALQNNFKSLHAAKKYQADQEACERLALLKKNNNHKKPKQEKKHISAAGAGEKPPDDDDPRNKNNNPPKKEPDEENNGKEKKAKTPNQQDEEDANSLGYKRDKNPPFEPYEGAWAFKKGNRWISRDVTSHKGGRWKMFNNKGQRLGTFDKNLNFIAE